MNTIRSSALLIALTIALLGTAFATALPTIDATASDDVGTRLDSAPEWSVFLAP